MKFLGTIVFVLALSKSFACSCINTTLSIKDYNRAALIVKAYVVEVTEDNTTREKIILLKVNKIYKGKTDDYITIRTSNSEASCGLNIWNDDKWLLFINKQNNVLSVNLCDKNIRYNKRPRQTRKSKRLNSKLMNSYIRKIKTFKNDQ